MKRHLVARLSVGLAAALLGASALAQPITWWEHSNPPHNNYSKELIADWNAKNPKTPVQYEFFAMTPYFQKLTAALSTRSAADMFTVIDTLMPSYTTKNTLAPIHPEWLGYKNLDDMKTHYLPGSLDGLRQVDDVGAALAQVVALLVERRVAHRHLGLTASALDQLHGPSLTPRNRVGRRCIPGS